MKRTVVLADYRRLKDVFKTDNWSTNRQARRIRQGEIEFETPHLPG